MPLSEVVYGEDNLRLFNVSSLLGLWNQVMFWDDLGHDATQQHATVTAEGCMENALTSDW